MKTKMAFLAAAMMAAVAQAEIEFPRGTLEAPELTKAKETAKAEKKLVAYLLTEKNTTCPLCQGASAEFIKLVKSKAVIVYLDSSKMASYWGTVPDSVRTELSKGKIIPKMVVTESDGTTVAAKIGYEAYAADERAALKEFKKGLKEEK